MGSLANSFKKNFPQIVTFVVIIIGFLVLLAMIGVNLNQQVTHNISKIVTVETFDSPTSQFSDSFCQKNSTQPDKLEEGCNQLTENSCNSTSCCVWAKQNENYKCVAGNHRGPTYRTDDSGNKLNVDHFFHKNTCKGSNCPTNN